MFIIKLGMGVFFSLQQIQQPDCRLRLFRRDAECSFAFGVLGHNIRYDAADILRDLPLSLLPFIRIYQQIAGIVSHRHGCPIRPYQLTAAAQRLGFACHRIRPPRK